MESKTATSQPQRLNNRYILHEELGAGGMGAVYRATDRLTDQVVALKRVLKTPGGLSLDTAADGDNLKVALTNEFQALVSLGHPNIIPVIDYGFVDQLPYFTMRYLPQARPITDFSTDMPQRVKLDLLAQMLRALAYLHRRGIVHRDLKPENALVDADNHLYLLDFGLAEENPQAVTEGRIAGTLAYIAPEVLQGAVPTQASDLYAVGVIAYELLGNAHPFDLSQPSQLIFQIIGETPDIEALDVPEALAQWVERLLAKTPQDRFASAPEALETLSNIAGFDLLPEDRDTWNSYLQAARFVGREDELGDLQAALGRAIDGEGSAWLIGGESGVGKSRLLHELRARAMVRGALTVTGQGVVGGGLPYQLWREPVRRLVLETTLSDLDASILSRIVPDLSRLIDRDIEALPVLDSDADQKRLIDAIIALIRSVQQPVVLMLEDLQWMVESLEVVRALAGAISTLPVLLLATYRSDEAPDLPETLSDLQTMMLGRMTEREISALSASMLGQSGREPQVLDLLQKETEGNVFFLVETVRALAEEAGTLGNVGRMTLPQTVFAGGVQRVIQRRLERISADYMPLLYRAAVFGRRVDLAVMEELAAEVDLEAWLNQCVNSAVFSVQDGQYRFSHDKIREAVVASLDEDEIVAISGDLARALDTCYPDDSAFVQTKADHWYRAGEIEKACRYAYQTGEQMRWRNPHDARLYLRRSLDLMPDDHPDRADVLRLLGSIYLYMSSYELAEQHYQQAVQLAGDENPHTLTHAYDGLCTLAQRKSDFEEAMRYARAALQTAERAADDRLISLALNSIGLIYMEQGEFAQARPYLEQSLERAHHADDTVGLSRAYNQLGVIAYRQGEPRQALDYFQKTLELRRELGMRAGVAAVLNNLGVLKATLGQHEQAIEHHIESRDIKRDIGDRFGEGNSLHNIGIAYMVMGDYDVAKWHFEEALVIARETGSRSGEADIHNNLGLIIRRLDGNLDEAITHLEQAITLGREINDRLTVALARSNLGDVLLVRGEIDAACRTLAAALREARAINAIQPLLRTIMWFGKLAQAQGDTVRAITLWSYVNLHPACDSETKTDTDRMLQALVDTLSAQEMADAIQASKAVDLDALMDDLLGWCPQ